MKITSLMHCPNMTLSITSNCSWQCKNVQGNVLNILQICLFLKLTLFQTNKQTLYCLAGCRWTSVMRRCLLAALPPPGPSVHSVWQTTVCIPFHTLSIDHWSGTGQVGADCHYVGGNLWGSFSASWGNCGTYMGQLVAPMFVSQTCIFWYIWMNGVCWHLCGLNLLSLLQCAHALMRCMSTDSSHL